MDGLQELGFEGMHQHPLGAMAEETGVLAELLDELGFESPRERDRTVAPGMVEEVIKGRLDEILLRPNLDHFCDASTVEMIEIPADDLPSGVAQGYFLKLAMLAPLSQDVEEPFQR